MKPTLLTKSLLSVFIAAAALVSPVDGRSQAVVFPQPAQPGTASFDQSDTSDEITLRNNILSAKFLNENGKLVFGGSPELGLKEGTELFTVALGEGETVIPASAMTVTSWEHEDLAGDPAAVVASEKLSGHAVKATLTYGDLEFEWRALLRDGSHYIRTELKLTAGKDVDMYNVIPMIYEVDKADAPKVVGNTRGSILASERIFAGLETPMGINSVESAGGGTSSDSKFQADEGFSYNSWRRDTDGDTQPANPAYWTWSPGSDLPQGVKSLGFTSGDVRGKRGFVSVGNSGTYTATFQYTSGTHGLNIIGVDVIDASGNVLASDYHIGFTGGMSRNNTFTLNMPQSGVFLVRYFVEIKTETITSSGTVTWSPSVSAAEKPASDVSGREAGGSVIQGLWSRNTTLAAGKTWEISAVVGLIAPGQARRSVLCYSERERAVPWRAFPIYNSWYELNIDRNNSPTYDGHMTATDCANVVKQWRQNLYEKHDANIKSFVWDDGWDEYGTWTFNKNFPNGFAEPYAEAAAMNAATGAWLGPVGGYGTSGDLRRRYWTNKGGMQLSNPAYYKVFLDACQDMVDKYDFNFFKLDGISAQGNSVGPDPGNTGEENAESIIDILCQVRKIRPDMFFNTTVGTWASPFWFHYSDAVWRQDADHSTIGNQGDDRERWITYRDYMVYKNFIQGSPLCPINTLMTHGVILTENGNVSRSMDYDGIVREIRCAFACGSGMVELYCDSKLLNTINDGALWGDIAECIKWQEKNADVLPDVHWVGGNPWDGAKANVYGWASWNGPKSTLALRNPVASTQTFSFTLREVLEIPAYVTSPIYLTPAFENQFDLPGLTTYEAIDPDTRISVTLPASSVFVFDGSDSPAEVPEDTYLVTISQPEHGTLKLLDGEKELTSGRRVEAGTVLTVSTEPDYGYMLESVMVNGVELEGSTIIVEESVAVSATFVRDPSVTVIYKEPSGNVRSNTYVKAISSEGADQNIDVTYNQMPQQVFNLVDQKIVAAPGSAFTVKLDAHSLGVGSNTIVRQDLRYDAAYVFVDWYATGEFELVKTYGKLPPSHNIYGNYDQVMNIAHQFTVPSDLSDGDTSRLRFIYANAWTVPGANSALSTNDGAKAADCDPNSQYVTDGACYDIQFTAKSTVGIDDINADNNDAPEEIYNLQGMRVSGKLIPGVYIIRKGNEVTKVLVK